MARTAPVDGPCSRSRTSSMRLQNRDWPLIAVSLNRLFIWPAHFSDASAAYGTSPLFRGPAS